MQAIERVSKQSGTGPGVATVRERDRLQSRSTSLRSLRVVVGQFGGLSTLTRALTRELRLCGAVVISVDEPDARAQAEAANQFNADVYVGFEARLDGESRVSYYAVPTFESTGGRSLAERLIVGLASLTDVSPCLRGMRLQVLRETRMPAVLLSLGSVRQTVDLAAEITARVRDAVEAWAGQPLPTGA